MQNDLDALSALLLVIRELTLRRSTAPCYVAAIHANELFGRLATFEPFCRVASAVYELVYARFIAQFCSENVLARNEGPSTEEEERPGWQHIENLRSQNVSLLRDMQRLGLIASTQDEQLKLLFWIDWFEARSEFQQAVQSAVSSNIPLSATKLHESVSQVLNAMNGDSRDYIEKRGFYF